VILILQFVGGMALLIAGGELLVRGAAKLAGAMGISSLVVGLTVVAYGTSAPELAVSVQSTYADPPQPDLAIGNVVGSNISNVLLVLGIAALVSPLAVSRQMVRSAVPLMVAIMLALLAVCWDGTVERWEGALLAVGAVLYSAVAVWRSRVERRALRLLEEAKDSDTSSESPASADSHSADAPPSATPRGSAVLRTAWQIVLLVVGIILLAVGANLLVSAAVATAKALGVNELVIGLTIVAVGTSLPEITTSVVAGFRRQSEVAIGNIVGSNIFNVLFVLGVCALVAPSGVAVSRAALNFDIPVMIAAAAVCLPIFYTGYVISRWEAAALLGYYAAYATYLFLQATEHRALRPYSLVMFLFVIPLTVLVLAMFVVRALRKDWASAREADNG
jgi:cation:H+ antiporter